MFRVLARSDGDEQASVKLSWFFDPHRRGRIRSSSAAGGEPLRYAVRPNDRQAASVARRRVGVRHDPVVIVDQPDAAALAAALSRAACLTNAVCTRDLGGQGAQLGRVPATGPINISFLRGASAKPGNTSSAVASRPSQSTEQEESRETDIRSMAYSYWGSGSAQGPTTRSTSEARQASIG